MSARSATHRLTHLDLARMHAAGEKIAMLTCYDASFAQLCEASGIDALLIGDSLGMVLQGHDTTLPVSVADIAYHTSAVARGSQKALIIADLPFGSFQECPQQAFRNAATLIAAGAQMIKLEGGENMAETTRFLCSRGIPVCAHVGLTPQSVHQLGGYRVQGKDSTGAAKLIADALAPPMTFRHNQRHRTTPFRSREAAASRVIQIDLALMRVKVSQRAQEQRLTAARRAL